MTKAEINKKIKIITVALLLICLALPIFPVRSGEPEGGATDDIFDAAGIKEGTDLNLLNDSSFNESEDASIAADHTARATVLKIINEKQVDDKGRPVWQQDLKLRINSGPLAGQEVEYYGISDIIVTNMKAYKPGDKVIVSYSQNEEGKNVFYITDFVRSGSLAWLLAAFIAAIFLVGKRKGLRALASLAFTFLFVIKVMAPLMLAGFNPLLIGLAGSFIILLLIVYLTDGFNRNSHIAVFSILVSLLATAALAFFFANLSRLSGLSDDEVLYLINAGKYIDFKNLLLAAIILGTLGIMDDVVVGQVEAAQQIKNANPQLPPREVYRRAMRVGRSHLGAVINTLFLAYAGAALPLLLLINLRQVPFVGFSDIINNEQIATEILRTLVGIIGLALSLPISTIMASFWLKTEKNPS